ncbi:MAG TPA: hypothetical protein VKB27_03330 [Gammaproteobacteria bacterium]|nr:hypothetical protein [Gammaproteobacteria bacterium]
MRAVVLPVIAYFGIVFGAGFALAPLRVLFVAPRLGEARAELLEIPVMLVIVYFAARYVVARFRIEKIAVALAVGSAALGLLLALEFTLVLAARGLTLDSWYAARDPAALAAYLAGLLVFALMPAAIRALHARRRGDETGD